MITATDLLTSASMGGGVLGRSLDSKLIRSDGRPFVKPTFLCSLTFHALPCLLLVSYLIIWMGEVSSLSSLSLSLFPAGTGEHALSSLHCDQRGFCPSLFALARFLAVHLSRVEERLLASSASLKETGKVQ